MGLTHLRARIAGSAVENGRAQPAGRLGRGVFRRAVRSPEKLGIQPHGKRSFILADGTEITRKVGDCLWIFENSRGASPVIIGEKGDSTLLGMVSLEAPGLLLDPIRRVLRPLPLLLGGSNR